MTQTKTFNFFLTGLAATVFVLSLAAGGCGGGGNRNVRPAINTSSRANPLATMFRVTVFAKTENNPASAYQCYLAQRPSQRDEGLSFVSNAELETAPGQPGHGMVFLYPDNRLLAFTGRNTLIDLDVVYAEGVAPGVGRIVDITTINAFQRDLAISSKPCQYVLMVQRGDLARSGAQVGDFLYVALDAPKE